MGLKTIKAKYNLSSRPEILGGVAQLALVASFLLGQFNVSHTDFLQGMLIGFSVVGNLALLFSLRSKKVRK